MKKYSPKTGPVNEELEALLQLAAELKVRTEHLPAELKALLAPAPHELVVDTRQPASAIAADLVAKLGRRRAMWVRTKLTRWAEAQDGHRNSPRDRV
jgi:hypothetical protein